MNIFLDLSKTIDTLDHDILSRKPDLYGINSVANKLLQSYKKQKTEVYRIVYIYVDIDKGSVLASLLFFVYISFLI